MPVFVLNMESDVRQIEANVVLHISVFKIPSNINLRSNIHGKHQETGFPVFTGARVIPTRRGRTRHK